MKKGFTVFEFIMVLLMITILMGIALPQYQLAVSKSRYARLMPMAKSIKHAEEGIYAETNSYTQDLSGLLVQVPGTVKAGSGGSVIEVGDGTVIEVFSNGEQDYVKASYEGLPNTFVMYFDRSGNFPSGIHCEAAKDGEFVNKQAKKLCENFGGKEFSGVGTSTDYVTYILEGPTTGTGSGASNSGGGYWNGTSVPSTVATFIENVMIFSGFGHLSDYPTAWVTGDNAISFIAEEGDEMTMTYNADTNTITNDGIEKIYYLDEEGNVKGEGDMWDSSSCYWGTCS